MRLSLLAALPIALLACSGNAPVAGGGAQAGETPPSAKPFRETVVTDFVSPWALAFLPDGRMLVTEKAGQMILLSPDGRHRDVVATIPVDSAGQGGLMAVVPAPDFATSRRIYFSYSARGNGGKGVVLARGTLEEDLARCGPPACPPPGVRLTHIEELFRARPFVQGDGHYSGRIAFSPDGGSLFFTNGERQKFTPAQDPQATLGKVLRLTLDGKPAPGNPLVAKGFAPEVWSYGHRNLLGIAFDAQGRLWEQEMGPKGGDELNLILPGRNYGWPNVSNGSHYDGRDIPDHAPGDGYEPPKVWWNPVISPGGLMIYRGSMFPQWKGDAFIGGLSSQSLVRVHLDGQTARKGDQWPMGARIRDVAEGPDGAIWVIEDGGRSHGRLIRLTAKQEPSPRGDGS